MDIDTYYTVTSADDTMDNNVSDIGIPSLDRARPIIRKGRPTVRKQQRSRIVLRRAVARLARDAKQTNPNLTIRITNSSGTTDDFDKMDLLEEMDLEDTDSMWQLPASSSIHKQQQRYPAATQFMFRDQVVKTQITDRWNYDDANDPDEVEDPNYF